MTNDPVQIIYLNGPSSSGKTTIAKALQETFEEPFLHVGIDKIIGWMPEKVNDWTGGEAPLGYSWKKGEDASGNPIQELQIGPYAKSIAKTFQKVIVALAKMGHHLIVDDVSFGRKQVEEWKKLLENFTVLWVGVNAPLPILEEREKQRGDRMLGSARGQFHKVHVDTIYDLEIDTHQSTLEENVKQVKSLCSKKGELARPYKDLLIRSMQEQDIEKVVSQFSFPWSTPEKTKKLWETYYRQQKERVRRVALAESKGDIVGYGSLLRKSEYPHFASANIPEVNAVWIDEKHRRQGIGKKLIGWIENLAREEGYHQIGIGVGLYRDYGPAQQLYFHLGYIPDGHGITYKGQSTLPGKKYPLDDDLILWLKKDLL